MIEDKNAVSPGQEIDNFFVKERLDGLLLAVNEREHKVLNLRFGLEDGSEHTLAQIAKNMKISRERVRQIEENAIKKLKKFMAEQDKEVLK